MPRRRVVEEEEEFDEEDYDDESQEFVVGDFVNEVLGHPRVSRLFGSLNRALDKFGQLTDQFGQLVQQVGPTPPGARPPNANGFRRPPPPPQRPKPTINPYVVLGFDPTKPVTVEMVKKRRKELAILFHPDKSGSEEALKRVNMAADMILVKLGAK